MGSYFNGTKISRYEGSYLKGALCRPRQSLYKRCPALLFALQRFLLT